jgi:hypothetical protein
MICQGLTNNCPCTPLKKISKSQVKKVLKKVRQVNKVLKKVSQVNKVLIKVSFPSISSRIVKALTTKELY